MAVDLKERLNQYKATTIVDQENALKEVTQEVILYALSKLGFFHYASFHGGTALRLCYGLDRFSEDLDFLVSSPTSDFDLSSYIAPLNEILHSFGLNFDVHEKEKTRETNIRTLYVKGNTIEHLEKFFNLSGVHLNHNETIRIKLDIEMGSHNHETYILMHKSWPEDYVIRVFDLPTLLASKINTILHRQWVSRVKGRDLYDYMFLLSHETKVNLSYVGGNENIPNLTLKSLQNILNEKFSTINYREAINDVLPFCENKEILALWNKEFFIELTKKLKAV